MPNFMNPELMPYLAAGLVALSVLAFGVLLVSFSRSRRTVHSAKARLARSIGHKSPETLAKAAALEANTSFGKSAGAAIGQLGERFKPKDEKEQADNRLTMIRAGLRHPNAFAIFWGAKVGLALVLSCAFLAVRVFVLPSLPLPMTMVGVTALALAGIYIPEFWLRMRVSGRKKDFLNAMPDALDLLVVSVESGMGLDQALQRVGIELRNASPVINEELTFVNLELRAGKSRKEALRNLAKRVDLDDITSLVTLLIQSDAFGTSIAQTLRVYSETLRTKRFQKAEEQAAKLPVKLLFPLIFFILPSLFVVIAGPAAITLIDVYSK